MKMFNLNSRLARHAAVAITLGLLMGAQTAMACTVGNWQGGSVGTLNAAQPYDPLDPATRYSGLCGLEVPGGQTAYVEDNSPAGIDRIRARFYVLADNSSDAVIYQGLAGNGGALFGVRLNPVSGDVRLFSAGANAICAGCANPGAWNSIEIDWNAGGGSLELWVNSDATVVAADASAPFSTSNTVSSVRLGNLNGAAGTLSFDAYESRRTTEIGRLCEGETSGDGTRTNDDVLEIFAEVSSAGTELADGQPDFTEDGEITNDDVLELFEIVANALGDCP